MDANRRTTALISGAALAALLMTAWFAYHPGLSGGFLFDDFANLPNLGEFGPIDNAGTFWHYITSGIADPTGRPLALLSFLIDAQDWPAYPYPFKRTSVLLHLLNGALLFWLLLKLGQTLRRPERQAVFAAAARLGPLVAASLFRIDHAVHRAARDHTAGNIHSDRPACLHRQP